MPPKNTTMPFGNNDLSGQSFGKLTVAGYTGRTDHRGNRLWDCVCECGKHVEATTVSLRRGRASDCSFGDHRMPVIKPCERCGQPFRVTKQRRRFCSLTCRDVNLIGERFGRLVVTDASGSSQRHRIWLCRCDCGRETTASTHNLRRGGVQSCGCLVGDTNAVTKTTHGDYGSKEYRAWLGMKKRCNYPNHKSYGDYGGRGIAVCDRWQESYETFLADVGRAPSPRHSIDRINNDGNYEPGNVRWATASEQVRNRRPIRRH